MFADLFTRFAAFLAIFMFGLIVMRHGLFQMAQERLQMLLSQLTDSAWKGMLAGMLITALLQSSSAVMVMLVGLVAARLMPFSHTIGVILGANIGTTVTAELITFQIGSYALWIVLLGVVLLLFKNATCYSLGCLGVGLGCLFLSMSGLSSLAEPVSSFTASEDIIKWASSHSIYGMSIGAILAAIIQSSTACIALAMGFLSEHIISLPTAITIMIGSNIGTCLTALLASIGTSSAAKQVAYANIWLNVFGALLFLPLIDGLALISRLLTFDPATQLAHASVIFNVVCSVLLLPFVRPFIALIEMLHGRMVAK
ncbi:Na/Pi symporter [Alkalicoccobacillus porphyridii]|uniref:Na/Pi cotransporter family protein n=1 Tax=Alkalicoccobacillus porphyridii TaxID=2597270 RepID=A0A553ZZA1_9BACI|nr:Na/Pi symporter [Alkalicoccobacillus porphyridii]TSB46767.1 Na/Pi cotransporter family protein [Alkalicoccobacillus porphyridii]